MGKQDGKTLMLLPGTACDYQTNFAAVLDRLGEKYHLICVNYDGFDGSDLIFPDIITVTEKIETYIQNQFGGRLNGAIGSSLGSTFVGQLIQRENIHIDHGIFGSPDLDQSGKLSAWLQSKLVVPLLTSFTKSEKKKTKTREKLKSFFEMDDETADFSPLTADDADLALTQAAHAARVKIDEKGVEAAAYTILTVGETAAAEKPEEMDFVLDRPFLFAIVSPDGLPLFTGVVNDPTA